MMFLVRRGAAQLRGVISRSAVAAGLLVSATFGIPSVGLGAVTIYQAESAARSNATVRTNISGFSGQGYVDYEDVAGSYVEFTVSVGTSGRARLTFVHSDNVALNRIVEIRVNGTVLANLSPVSFGRTTTSGANWQTRSVWTILNAGSNKIRLTAVTAAGGPNIDRLEVDDNYTPGTLDLAQAVSKSIMTRFPTPASFGPWDYTRTLLMQSLLSVATASNNTAQRSYVRTWVDARLDSNGNVKSTFDELDDFQGGVLLLRLFDLTGQAKYRNAAAAMFARFGAYPTTSDGAWLQRTTLRGAQLWLDGTFMAMPFALEYGQRFDNAARINDKVADQLLTYAGHLQDEETGLLFHAYDELGEAGWLGLDGGNRSANFWCRSNGWYGMALLETLSRLPADHTRRAALVEVFAALAQGIIDFQDPITGLWFQVVDRGGDADNWTETSCSAIYALILSRGVDLGLLDERVIPAANRAFQGVLQRTWLSGDRLPQVEEVVIGTSPGNLAQYYTRPRTADDLHGLAAFIRMYDRMGTLPPGTVARWFEAESGTRTAPLTKRFSASATNSNFLQAQGAAASTVVPPANGIARYTVSVPRSSTYRLWARMNAQDPAVPAFWIRFDGEEWIPWGSVGNRSTLWYWDVARDAADQGLPAAFELDEGDHVLEIAYAQPSARLDRLLVTDSLQFFPGNGGF
ncbi:MAG: glycoside hydrolase family 88 protein [Geminicoccaceae bacterium]